MSHHPLALLLTEKASADELAIYRYISEVFGQVYAEKFRTKLVTLFRLIVTQPYLGRPSKPDISIRVVVISKQNKLVYTVSDSAVIILRILNTKTAEGKRF